MVQPPPPNLPPQYHDQWRLQQLQQQQQFMRMQQARPNGPMPSQAPFNQAPPFKFMSQGPMMMPGQQRPPVPYGNARPPPQQQQQLSRSALLGLVPPYRDEMDEAEFVNSLGLFLQCFNFNLQRPFLLAGRPIPLKHLFATIKAFGGFGKVTEGRRWPAVGASLGFPPGGSQDLLTSLHSFCGTFLLPYEQFMVHKLPAESITIRAQGPRPPPSEQHANRPMPQHPPPAPSPASRLASTASNGPSASPAPPPALMKPLVPPVAPLEALSAQQWKSITALRDPFVVLKRGRVGYRDLQLCLASGLPHLVSYGLNLLQALALDLTVPLPDPASMMGLIEGLAGLYRQHSKRMPPATRLRDTLRMRDELHYWQGEHYEEQHPAHLCDLVSHILRLWRCRPAGAEALDRHHGLAALMLGQVVHGSFLETRANFLAFLSDAPPSAFHGVPADALGRFYQWTKDELDTAHALILSSTHRASVGLYAGVAEQPQLEAAKKAIVQTMQVIAALFRALPPSLHLLLEILVGSSLSLQDGALRRRLSKPLLRLVSSLLRLASVLLQPLALFTALVQRLMARDDFWGSGECHKWLLKMVHGASFGFSDAGYAELLLLALRGLLRALPSPASEGAAAGIPAELVGAHRADICGLVTHAEGLRRLWLCRSLDGPLLFEKPMAASAASAGAVRRPPGKGTGSTEQSPLLWAPITATTSNPYRLLTGTLSVLSGLAEGNAPAVGRVLAEGGSAELLAAWTDPRGVANSTSREVLGAEAVVGPSQALLDAVLTHQFMACSSM
jgi:hypothetical protein